MFAVLHQNALPASLTPNPGLSRNIVETMALPKPKSLPKKSPSGVVGNGVTAAAPMLIKIMQRMNDQAYAQSHPVIELIDTKSRRNFYITIGAAAVTPFPTTPEGDFFGKDFGVGNAIVSTTFRDNPSFGVRLSGNGFWCNTANNTGSCPPTATLFAFRLRRQDIVFVLAKARTLDSALSPDIADYAIDNFSFNNEVSSPDGQLGLTLTNYTLSIFNR